MSRTKKCIPLLTLFLAAALLSHCTKEDPRTEEEPVVRPVRYQKVFPTSATRIRTFSGAARPATESQLSFKVAGTVNRLKVKVGDRVERGMVLAELDPTDYHLMVEEIAASLSRASAQARNAEADYDRVRALFENNNASRNDLDAARAGAESSRAEVRSIEKRLELTRLQMSYTTLEAAVDGVITGVQVEVNENVGAGAAVVVLASGKVPEVQVAIPEILIAEIREGRKATVTFDAIPGREFPAKVTEVGVSPVGLATTFPVTVSLEKVESRIRPGMAAEVAFVFGTAGKHDRFLVPTHSVAEDGEGRHVFVVEPSEPGFGTALRRAVRIGQLTEGGLEIVEGLETGDMVVTAGITRISDGMKVRIPDTGEKEP